VVTSVLLEFISSILSVDDVIYPEDEDDGDSYTE
jgi:hypothetical protein